MPWSYDSASTSALAQVRRWIGDTNASSKLVDDEVIEGLLDGGTDAATILRAAATAARFCLAAMARDPDRSIEGLQVTRARIEAYQSIVDDLDIADVLHERRQVTEIAPCGVHLGARSVDGDGAADEFV